MPRVKPEDRVTPEQIEEFIDWLVAQRKELGWTQEKMSNHLGFSTPYYNSLENGRKIPVAKTVYHIASVLNCPEVAYKILGEETASRIADELDEKEHVDEKDEEDQNIEEFRYIDEASKEIDNLLEQIKNHSFLSVKVHPILEWFGYSRNQIALLKPLREPVGLEHGKLVYVINKESKKRAFMFILTKPYLTLVFPEMMILERFRRIKMGDMDNWGFDPSVGMIQLPFSLSSNYAIFDVLAIMDDLSMAPIPFMCPQQRWTSKVEVQKNIIDQLHLWEGPVVTGQYELPPMSGPISSTPVLG
ncbi:helix-turn-helix transcriptional regulator [Alicyclobacillus tolerans]|uniref:helix-turn-helix domain-containing protein n=1 Tax=Alicyclobacillus tolerans TaxID=90970 RepID=UPI001F43458A|nr:helix-turn-helix transcriptional regulator [Alicyclobacillus tolerans]MCF8568388.1 helix-turn-helix transcriptional regulator [Alicyclobacillus tolerans]